ncbi:conserved hypothetical protein [Talaromyces stipitatus ATCC 10500]|uniref:Uncharacterized protein n=1 Tax=Talaromyces stipitatus (strain ATCC 10500 / CBS 375.48 / QM 6759 / NRRL 1006) TaxID=441959 RepID=B8ML31_TALSN|nr:uncharacterized protein TSTA_048870 [Talaromyces stipitatus ATCC 10500]EED15447.1 conserved hypothetical protein [Talaromyces stipitatus ATCC 10500]
MAPDLNSLPPSRSSTSSPLHARNNWPAPSTEGQSSNDRNHSSSRSSSIPPAAAMNPLSSADLSHGSPLGGGHRSSPQSTRPSISEGRRRSHLNLNDSPSAAAIAGTDHHEHRSPSFSNYFRTASPSSLGGSPIIATGDPHHQRAPSLGELHQELEQEQEAQVNRLLQMIRQQQLQLQQLQLQQQQGSSSTSGTAVVDDNNNLTPNSERSHQFPTIPPLPTPGVSRSSTVHSHSHSPFSTRRGSRGSETAATAYQPFYPLPNAPPSDSVFDLSDVLDRQQHDSSIAARRGSLDDNAYYQAEIASLNRDNRMLRARIRVLERQIAELSSSASSTGAAAAGNTDSSDGPSVTTTTATATQVDADTGSAATQEEPRATEKDATG